MARKIAGRRYPFASTDARQHDHRFCPVVAKLAKLAGEGAEAWGTVHAYPVSSAAQADDAKRGIYRARKHGYSPRAVVVGPGGQLASGAIVPEGSWVVEVQVFTRAAAKSYIAGQVQQGRPLAYNVLRRESA